MKLKLLTLFGLILAVGVVLAGSGDTVDIPEVTLVYPTDLSTVQVYPALIAINCSTSIPSNDLDSHLVNVTLYHNITEEINYTGFVGYPNTLFNASQPIVFTEIETINIGNGTSNSTLFTPILFTDGDYVTYSCLACNYDGNCSWGDNYSFFVQTGYDTEAPTIDLSYPIDNDTIITPKASTQINFTATDNVHIQNVTLFVNFTTTDWRSDTAYNWSLDSNITFIENSTITNDGTATGWISNDGNTTLIGNFSDFNAEGDGFYFFYLYVCDYNNTCTYSSNYSFEWDTTAPYTTEVGLVHTPGSCDKYTLTWNVTEASNYDIDYGTNGSNLDQTVSSSSYSNSSMEINLTNLGEFNKVYQVNMSICDEHGNCNYSATNLGDRYENFTKEFGVCAGWNAFSVLNETTRMDAIAWSLNENVTTTVSWWNETNQTFINHIAGLSSNAAHAIARGDAYMIHTNASSFSVNGAGAVMNVTANTSLAESFAVNISGNSGGNWTHFGLLQDWQMYNISYEVDNCTYYSYYNNSLQKYVDHIDGWLWNNQTQMREGDSIWVWGKVYNFQWYRNETQVAD